MHPGMKMFMASIVGQAAVGGNLELGVDPFLGVDENLLDVASPSMRDNRPDDTSPLYRATCP